MDDAYLIAAEWKALALAFALAFALASPVAGWYRQAAEPA